VKRNLPWGDYLTQQQKRRWAVGWTIWTSSLLGFNLVASRNGIGPGAVWWAIDVAAWVCALLLLFFHR
jgi:hypothetical protein